VLEYDLDRNSEIDDVTIEETAQVAKQTKKKQNEFYCPKAFIPWLKDNIKRLISNNKVSIEANNTCRQRFALASEERLLKSLNTALHSSDSLQQLAEALKANWDVCQLSFVGYTARPNHELTELLCDIAIFIATHQEKQPLQILMPGIKAEHLQDINKDLNADCKDKLLEILRTHILSDNRHYLFPVELLVDLALSDEKITLDNPFCDFTLGSDAQGQIKDSEIKRLFNHSPETKALFETRQEYKRAINKESLLFHLNDLVNHLEFNSSHGGIGSGNKPGDGSYDAIIRFLAFYGQILEKQADKIHADIKSELDFLYQLVTNPQANQKGSKNNSTCIGIRKDILRPLVSKHAATLNAISLDESQCENHLKALDVKFYNSKQQLKKSLANRNYEGCDPLGITRPLLKRYNLAIHFSTKEELDDLLDNEPQELEAILSSSDKLKQQVMDYLSDIEVFVTFALQTSPSRLKLTIAKLGVEFVNQIIQNQDDLVTSLVLLSDEKFKLVFDAFKFRVSDSFLLTAIERLNTTQLRAIFDELELHQGMINYQDSNTLVTPLNKAAFNGYDKIVLRLIESGAEVDKADKYGGTPIYYAAKNGYLESVMMLLRANSTIPKSTKRNRFSPLCLAARKADLNIINQLIKLKVNVNAVNEGGDTPLCIAVQKGDLPIVNALIQAKANVNKADETGHYPLYLAVKEGHLPIIEALIAAGANVNVNNNYGNKLLCIAAQRGDLSIVNMLIQAKANINETNGAGHSSIYLALIYGHLSVVRALIVAGANIHMTNEHGKTLLCIAAEKGYLSIVNELIKAKMNVNVADDAGHSPIYLAAKEGHLPIVKALIAAGAEVNVETKYKDTPLCIAAEKGYLLVVCELIKSRVHVNNADDMANTPLYLASKGGHLQIVRALIAAGAVVYTVTEDGEPPLYIAVEKGYLPVVNELIEAMSVNKAANFNQLIDDAIRVAIEFGHLEIFKALIEAQDDFNIVPQSGVHKGRSILHMLASNGRVEMIQLLLLKRQADINLIANDGPFQGCSSLFIAIHENHTSIAELLINNGASINQFQQAGPYQGINLLHMASFHGNLEITAMLLKHNAIAYLKQRSGSYLSCSPLYIAANRGHASVVERLIESGAEANTLEGQNRNATAIATAALNGHAEVVRILIENGVPFHSYHRDLNTDFFKGNKPIESALSGNHVKTLKLIEQAIDIFDFSKNIVAANKWHINNLRYRILPDKSIDDESQRIFRILFKNKSLIDSARGIQKQAFIDHLAQTELKERDITEAFKIHSTNANLQLENQSLIVQFSTNLYTNGNSKDNLKRQNQENEPNCNNGAHRARFH